MSIVNSHFRVKKILKNQHYQFATVTQIKISNFGGELYLFVFNKLCSTLNGRTFINKDKKGQNI